MTIQPISYPNYGYSTLISSHQIKNQQVPLLHFRASQPEQEQSPKRNKTALWLMIGGLATTALLFALTRGKKGVTSTATKTAENTAQAVEHAATKTGSRADKYAGKSVEELQSLLKTLDKNDIEHYHVLNEAFEKAYETKGPEAIDLGNQLIKYYDDIMAGKISYKSGGPLSTESFLTDASNNWGFVRCKRSDICANLSHIYKHNKQYDKALDMMAKASFGRDPYAKAEMAKIHALRGTYDEGLDIAKRSLEKCSNEIFGDDQVALMDSIAECLKRKGGREDLVKSIELLKKGSYHFDQLTAEDIKFFTDKNIDYKRITGERGREQTGAMAKWVLEQLG